MRLSYHVGGRRKTKAMCCCGSLGRPALFTFLSILVRKNIYYNVYCSFINTFVETFNISHNSFKCTI